MRIIQRFIFPPRCALCDDVTGFGNMGICERCDTNAHLVRGSVCKICGRPISEQKNICEGCSDKNSVIREGRALFLYDDVMRDSIIRFKYGKRQEYAAYYAETAKKELGNWIKDIGADCLIPVPIHISRYKKRGYNQAFLFARELSGRCGIETYSDILIRNKKTLPQKELSKDERKKNLKKAFCISDSGFELCRKIRCAIIIDDIYTTGSTLETCGEILNETGISEIYSLCICIGENDMEV